MGHHVAMGSAVSTGEQPMSFGAALAQAMIRRGYSLADVQSRLRDRGHAVSLGALSYWRSGGRTPRRQTSMEAVPELEAVLGLEAGALQRLIPLSPGRSGEVVAANELLGLSDAERVVGEDDVRRVATHLTGEVGRAGEVIRVRLRNTVTALRDGVAGMTLVAGRYDGAPMVESRLQTVAGGEITEMIDHEGGVRSTWFAFDRPLAAGETTVFEYDVLPRGEWHLTDMAVIAEQRLEDVTVWIRFLPGHLPPRSWVFVRELGLNYEWPVDLAGGSSISYRQSDFGPGMMGARWEW